MPLYLTIRAGDNPADALPIFATTDTEAIRALMRAVAWRIEEEAGDDEHGPIFALHGEDREP